MKIQIERQCKHISPLYLQWKFKLTASKFGSHEKLLVTTTPSTENSACFFVSYQEAPENANSVKAHNGRVELIP